MRGNEIPQADNLATVRKVVGAIAQGATTRSLVEMVTGITARHVSYYLNASLLLQLVTQRGRDWSVSKKGSALLETDVGSDRETDLFTEVIRNSVVFKRVAPTLLDKDNPSLEQIAAAITELTDLAPATARRRARTLLRWRAQTVESTRGLFPHEPDRSAGGATSLADTKTDYGAASTQRENGLHLCGVSISRFGAIRDVRVGLSPFTVFIGRNATGKSTFMDSLVFVKDALLGGPLHAVGKRARRLEELLWFGKGDSFEFAFDFFVPRALRPRQAYTHCRYELRVGRTIDETVGVLSEAFFLCPQATTTKGQNLIHSDTPKGWKRIFSLSQKGIAWYKSETSDWGLSFQIGQQKLALSTIPEAAAKFPLALRIRNLFERGVQRLALHPESMKRPCSPMKGDEFLLDGSNLPLVLKSLKDRKSERFQEWLEHLQEAIPDIQFVKIVEREDDRHVYIVLQYRGGFELPAWRLSEGTLRILALTLLPFIDDREAIYLIEEPENGVHPQAVEGMHQAIAYPMGIQILLATHSPVFVGIVRPDQLLCFSREGGSTEVIPGAEHPAIKSWKKNVDLGTLFASSVL